MGKGPAVGTLDLMPMPRFFSCSAFSRFVVSGGVLALAFAAQGAARRDGSAPPSAREIRFHQNEWRAALRDADAGRPERAARRMRELEAGDSLEALYRISFLASLHMAAGRPARADSLLAFVLAGELGPPWQNHFIRRRLQSFDRDASPAAKRGFLERALAAPLEDPLRADVLYRLVRLSPAGDSIPAPDPDPDPDGDPESSASPRDTRNARLRMLLDVAVADARMDSLYRRVAPEYPHGKGTWEEQMLMLDFEEKLERWPEALVRADAARSLASGEKEARFLQGKIALWYYNRGGFTESIRQYEIFRSLYGDTPEASMQTARAYRGLGDEVHSQQWYSRLVERHPRDPRTAEVLWMRAFDAEVSGRMDEAIRGYARILAGFPGHMRAWESMFRLGLVHYKWGVPERALNAFRDLQAAEQAPGRLLGAARYWEGKTLLAMGDSVAARGVWEDFASAYPFGFYGHMARRDWIASGGRDGRLDWRRRLNVDTGDAVREWLTAHVPAARAVPEGFGESLRLPIARLMELGLDTLALITLQDRVRGDSANAWLLYDAAARCREAGFDQEAYRFARRLSDRLPLALWASAPVPVLRLFYPPSYEDVAGPEAVRAGVPLSLVFALIKQESGFDPAAVSRAGARGLMQIMPATGAEQARKEGMMEFHPDMLFDPEVNARLGIAYLRDVLRRDDGNVHYALAHYNAGPTALQHWRPRLEGRLLEEAVEDIGYAETREYVKRVLANYWTYQALWE